MTTIFSLDINDYQHIDSRLTPFLSNWQVEEIYKNKIVNIPSTWNSSIFPVKYFKVIKTANDPNAGEEENEVGLTLWAGWKEDDNSGCYDHEVEINLFILGKDVSDMNSYQVGAEILRTGSAKMKVFFKNNLVTEFTKTHNTTFWFFSKKTEIDFDKVWINDMKSFL